MRDDGYTLDDDPDMANAYHHGTTPPGHTELIRVRHSNGIVRCWLSRPGGRDDGPSAIAVDANGNIVEAHWRLHSVTLDRNQHTRLVTQPDVRRVWEQLIRANTDRTDIDATIAHAELICRDPNTSHT